MFSALDRLITRRRLVLSTGLSIAALTAAPVATGHGDSDHDDSDHDGDDDSGRGRGRGRGGDDDEVQPLGTIPAGSVEVRITDDDADGFEPGTVTIDLGSSVTWTNLDDDPHTATGAAFDTGTIHPGELVTMTFDEAGQFPYSCQFHPEMTGSVSVRDGSGNVPTNHISEATPGASPQASSIAGGEQSTVSIVNIAFDPAELSVPVGATVVWTNNEDIPHTVFSPDNVFGSDILERGDAFQHQFDTIGTFDYICGLHPSMQGRVIVTE